MSRFLPLNERQKKKLMVSARCFILFNPHTNPARYLHFIDDETEWINKCFSCFRILKGIIKNWYCFFFVWYHSPVKSSGPALESFKLLIHFLKIDTDLFRVFLLVWVLVDCDLLDWSISPKLSNLWAELFIKFLSYSFNVVESVVMVQLSFHLMSWNQFVMVWLSFLIFVSRMFLLFS